MGILCISTSASVVSTSTLLVQFYLCLCYLQSLLSQFYVIDDQTNTSINSTSSLDDHLLVQLQGSQSLEQSSSDYSYLVSDSMFAFSSAQSNQVLTSPYSYVAVMMTVTSILVKTLVEICNCFVLISSVMVMEPIRDPCSLFVIHPGSRVPSLIQTDFICYKYFVKPLFLTTAVIPMGTDLNFAMCCVAFCIAFLNTFKG